MSDIEIYRAAMDTFGEVKQTKKLFEEIGEFMDAFNKCLDGRDRVSHVAEEMADVHNMLDQWAVKLGCTDEVERMKRYKLRRLEQRIECERCPGKDLCNHKDGKANGLVKWLEAMEQK